MDAAADQPWHEQLLHHPCRLAELGGDECGEEEETLILDDVSSERTQTLSEVDRDAPINKREETVLGNELDDVAVEPEEVLLERQVACNDCSSKV